VHRSSGALVWDVRWAEGQIAIQGQAMGCSGTTVDVQCSVCSPCFHMGAAVDRPPGMPGLACRAERILCMALEYEGEASKPTCACWVGQRANCFAVGYDDGSVLLWGVPSQALQGEQRRDGGWKAAQGCLLGGLAEAREVTDPGCKPVPLQHAPCRLLQDPDNATCPPLLLRQTIHSRS